MTKKREIWEKEYFFFLYPDAPMSDTKYAKATRKRLLAETDFSTEKAMAFKAGWEAAMEVAQGHINCLLNRLGGK